MSFIVGKEEIVLSIGKVKRVGITLFTEDDKEIDIRNLDPNDLAVFLNKFLNNMKKFQDILDVLYGPEWKKGEYL